MKTILASELLVFTRLMSDVFFEEIDLQKPGEFFFHDHKIQYRFKHDDLGSYIPEGLDNLGFCLNGIEEKHSKTDRTVYLSCDIKLPQSIISISEERVISLETDQFYENYANYQFSLETTGDVNFDINQQDEEGRTLLHYAATSSFPGTVIFLLKKGANPHITDHQNRLPIHADYAGISDNSELMHQAFLDHQIDRILSRVEKEEMSSSKARRMI